MNGADLNDLNDLNDRYERLRRGMTKGGLGQGDGLSVLHQRGLHAWIAHVVAAPPPPSRAAVRAASTGDPIALAIGRSPLVGLCTDMLLATLSLQEA